MSKYQVPAVVGAVKILNELGGLGDAGATQSQLVGTTGLSKSTLHNLLSTLESSGFVRKDPDSRIYHLGPALIPLGSAASRQIKLVRSAMDRLEPLATREHLSFAVAQRIDQDQAQIIERFYPARDVHVGITVGSSYGPMDGALGKVLLAGMDRERAKKLIKGRKLPAHTPSTITSPESLLEDVDGGRRGRAEERGGGFFRGSGPEERREAGKRAQDPLLPQSDERDGHIKDAGEGRDGHGLRAGLRRGRGW